MLLDLLLFHFRRARRANTLLVTIDDAHWADEQTWSLAEAAVRSVPGLCLVLAAQPMVDERQPKALEEAGVLRLQLGELEDDDQEHLALARLAARHIAPDLSTLLRARARGHPFFCMELAQALLDDGVIEVMDGTARIARNVDVSALPLPETVHGTVTRRIDRLDPDTQVTLKVASVAGLRFPARLVADVHPMTPADYARIDEHLNVHHRIGLLLPDDVQERNGYAFRHGAIRDVAYGLMVYSQRRELHRKIAAWYEQMLGEERSRVYAVLAYHLEAAGEPEQAAEYLRTEADRVFGQGLARQSVEIGLHAAQLLGASLPIHPASLQPAIAAELDKITALLGTRGPADLSALPVLDDARVGQLIQLLLMLAPFAHQSEQLELFALMGCVCLRLTLEHGNGPHAPDVYSMYSVVHGALTGDRVTAAAWSRLGLGWEGGRRGAQFSRSAHIHSWFHTHWIDELGEGIALASDGAEAGLADNEITFGCFNLSASVVLLATAGRPLEDIIAEARRSMARNGRRVINAHYHLVIETQLAKALAGLTSGLTEISDEGDNEARDIASLLDSGLSNQIGFYYTMQVKLHVHAGNWNEALQWADRALPLSLFFSGQPAEFELPQYRGLAALATAIFGAAANRRALIDDGWDCTELFRRWERLSPSVFGHKADLLDGMRLAAAGSAQEAIPLLQRASARAGSLGFLHDAGLAAEYRARCLRYFGDPAAARQAAAQACELFAEWGAAAKVSMLSRDFELSLS
jgi:hypothetical protein